MSLVGLFAVKKSFGVLCIPPHIPNIILSLLLLSILLDTSWGKILKKGIFFSFGRHFIFLHLSSTWWFKMTLVSWKWQWRRRLENYHRLTITESSTSFMYISWQKQNAILEETLDTSVRSHCAISLLRWSERSPSHLITRSGSFPSCSKRRMPLGAAAMPENWKWLMIVCLTRRRNGWRSASSPILNVWPAPLYHGQTLNYKRCSQTEQ